jgi:protein-tyrosine-phosphatase
MGREGRPTGAPRRAESHAVAVTADRPRTVLFVCAHGAYRSRLAAAFFNAAAPMGWRAASAGQDPQDTVSEAAIRLASGTPAEAQLDRGRPQALARQPAADRVVAVDCDVPNASRWTLEATEVGPAQRDEIRARAERLAAELSGG